MSWVYLMRPLAYEFGLFKVTRFVDISGSGRMHASKHNERDASRH
jgi:hypothetical protein